MDLARIIDKGKRYLGQDGPGLAGLTVLQKDMPSDIEALIYEPVLCLILQGRKVTLIGNQSAQLGPGDALLVSHDLPVTSRITEASPQVPYLALILSLDMGIVRGLYEQLADVPMTEGDGRPLAVSRAGGEWLAPLERYLDLMDKPLDARVLGPAILREIHYRLLLSPIGRMLRSLLIADSHASCVARAIQRLRREFRGQLRIPELARTAGMSTTSFHQHFKAVTGTTPLQYQKDLRLIAARSLVVLNGQTVTEAAFATGYESPTHFSRDYSRKFGKPPSHETRNAAGHI